MSFSINTNIASLEAQNYLRASSDFQSKTINRVTSGLRIINSGDDAAGLAIANGFRSDQAVLTQGIRNANDGLSTLQTIDGGMNDISQLLDRARTLATQSASGTFTGDRSVLNSEFQSVIAEIDRQAESIGLNSGGQFAKSLQVFIGGGKASGSTTAISNGSVSVDLTQSTVDTRSLGLTGFAATGNSAVDIGTGAGTTSVANILANTTNQGTEAQSGYSQFYFSGPGFSATSGTSRIGISVNLSGVTDANTLAAAINSAIEAAGNGTSQQATAFKNAGIQASVYTDASGASHLRFTSSSSAFQVEAGDAMANALLGNIQTGAQGQSVATTTAATDVTAMQATAAATENNVKITVIAGTTPATVSLNITSGEARATTVANLNTALSGTGVSASLDGSNKLQFTDGQGHSLQVQVSGDTSNVLGLGTFLTGAANAFSYSTFTAAAAVDTNSGAGGVTENLQVAIGSQVVDLGSLAVGTDETAAITALNAAFQGNALTKAANLVAGDDGSGKIVVTSGNGTLFRLNAYGASAGDGTGGFGFLADDSGSVDSSTVATLTATAMNGSASPSLDANGTSTSGYLYFTGISVAGASQTITLTAPDSSGASHSISIGLTSSNAGNIDAALNTINTALLQSNDTTLQKLVAVKDQSSGADGIRCVSSLSSFTLSVGSGPVGNNTTASGLTEGIYTVSGANTVQGGAVITSSALGTGSTADIGSLTNAQNAVSAISSATTALGRAQAAVGKGENVFNYAINLAQIQLTNEAAAESRIRDADLAAEAANLAKAQILVQAGTAALAQANSAPQAILTLLRG